MASWCKGMKEGVWREVKGGKGPGTKGKARDDRRGPEREERGQEGLVMEGRDQGQKNGARERREGPRGEEGARGIKKRPREGRKVEGKDGRDQ